MINNVKFHLLMALAVVLVAISFPVISNISAIVSPEVLVFYRFLFSVIIFTPLALINYRSNFKGTVASFIASIPLVIFFYCMFICSSKVNPLNLGAIYMLVPISTYIFSVLARQDKITAGKSSGFIIALIGALLVITKGVLLSVFTMRFTEYDLIYATGCLVLGSYNSIVKRATKYITIKSFTYTTMSCGTALLFAINLATGESFSIPFSKEVIISLIYLSLITTLLTFYIVNTCSANLGPSITGAYGYITPVAIIVFSALWNGLTIEPYVWIGSVIIVSSVFYINRTHVTD